MNDAPLLRIFCVPRATPAFALLLLLIATCIPLAYAQDAVGSLEGRIVEQSGNVVPGGTVVLKNLETTAIRKQTSDADGLYRFVLLSVGHYSLVVDVPNFARFSQSPIEITVSQTSRVDVPLALGSITETVFVTSAPPAIDTSTNSLGKEVSGKEVLDLPLNGRNFAQLGLLQTGVAPLSSGVTTEGGSLRQGQS